MKKMWIAFVAICLLVTINYIYIVNRVINIDDEFKKSIGKEIVLGKDTLIVIDYSALTNTYTLSNGYKINKALLD
jgi:hypothetical protein